MLSLAPVRAGGRKMENRLIEYRPQSSSGQTVQFGRKPLWVRFRLDKSNRVPTIDHHIRYWKTVWRGTR